MDKKEATFFNRLLRDEVMPILRGYAERRQLSDLAKTLGIEHRSRLTELKNGNRKLTFFWLNIFIKGGLMTVDNILKGRSLSELNEVEQDTVLRLDPAIDTLMLIYKAKREGIDINTLLRTVIKDKE